MKLIDVTFRESVYCKQKIQIPDALKIIRKLSSAGLDYIEIGYLKSNRVGSPFLNYNPSYINNAFLNCKGVTKLSAMIHPEDFNPKHWSISVLKKIALIRICVNNKNINSVKQIIDYFHGLGIQVSLNLTRVSNYSPKQCQSLVSKAERLGADIFYLADSNGHLLPEEIKKYINMLCANVVSTKIGFHAHDNLGLAQVNALEALTAGAKFIDCSILGFGKGAGNLKTELFPLLLARKKLGGKFKINQLMDIAIDFQKIIIQLNPLEEMYKFAIYGLYNVSLDEDKAIIKLASEKGFNENDLVFLYINQCKRNLKKLEALVNKKTNKLGRKSS